MPHQPAYTHNAQPISREQFYAIACDPARSVAVEACAGAGKTWMLVSRMLRALLGGAAPHEILAITFTKKAAGEMRQRLQEWLEDFAHQPLEQLEKELLARGIDENSLQGAQDKRKQLQNLYQTLLASGRPLQIRTFHSWFAALLSSAPLALLQERGLPTHYELLEDDKEAKAEVWRPFLQAVAQDAGLHADYAAIVAAHGRSQAHKALEAALDKRVEFQLADEAGIVDASVPPFGTQHPALAGLEFPAQALAGDMAQARWLARAKLLGAESNKTPQKAADAVVDAFACADLDARLDGLRKAFFVATADRLSKNLEKFAPAQEAEPELQQLCAARAQHAAWQHQDRMARLSRCLIVCFAALKRARGWVDMNDVERTALTLLSDPILSGWVQERLDARVRHLLIDEFQDTNPLQWQALHAWLSGYAGAGGGQAAPSVFIVGDPKQSIYRFRRAEPQVFRAAQAFVQDAFGGDLLACDHTRRNALGVIATVNSAMQAAQDAQEYSGFRQHTTESDQAGLLQRLPPITKEDAAQDEAPAAEEVLAGDGGVQGLPWRDSLTEPRHEAEETQRMQECAQAARWVAAQLASGLQPKDIMVLARQRERLARLAEALRAQHIPCVQPEKADLAEAPEVQDMVALLDVLVSPAHDLSLARALKSPLFGCDDALLTALARLRRQEEYQQFSWFDLLQKQELFTLDINALAANLTQYKDWVAELPPHDALQAIYQHGDVLARFAAAAPAPQRTGVLANLRALLGAALQQDGGRYLTPYAFVRALKKGGIPAPARADVGAVRLLTVHGAKGLEAHSVLLLDTDALPKKAESMAVLVDWPGEQELPRRFIFLASESRPPPSAEGALAQELAERQREALNTLYVAVTRAKQCLALSCVQASRANPGSWWARLAPLMQQDVQPQASAVAADAHADAAFTLLELPRLLLDQATPAAQPKPPEPEGLSARQGQAMHALLEQVGAAGLPLEVARTDGWNARRLAKLAREFALPAAAAQAAAAMAQTILNGEGAWAWDEAQLELAVNEAPLQHQGQSLRLDRLVRLRTARGGAHWWVLDYKSAAEPQQQPELMAQLQRYRQAVQLQQPGEAVGAAFLTGEGRVVVMGD